MIIIGRGLAPYIRPASGEHIGDTAHLPPDIHIRSHHRILRDMDMIRARTLRIQTTTTSAPLKSGSETFLRNILESIPWINSMEKSISFIFMGVALCCLSSIYGISLSRCGALRHRVMVVDMVLTKVRKIAKLPTSRKNETENFKNHGIHWMCCDHRRLHVRHQRTRHRHAW